MPSYETILYEEPEAGIARIVMNRPAVRNAQNLRMTYELNAAFDHAVQDEEIKVIILAGADPHFSSGHDLQASGDTHADAGLPVIGTTGGVGLPGNAGLYAREQEVYLQMIRRWRDLSKPTIAQVQGRCIAGGLMLAWACDLIIASEDAQFCDPVVAMGVSGVEWFAHPWELGGRKAKELLWTTDSWSAEEAWRLGMVNHVVERYNLADFTLSLARKIASKPAFAVKTTKEAVNQTLDMMGFQSSVEFAFRLHHLCHAHNRELYGIPADPAGLHKAAAKKS